MLEMRYNFVGGQPGRCLHFDVNVVSLEVQIVDVPATPFASHRDAPHTFQTYLTA